MVHATCIGRKERNALGFVQNAWKYVDLVIIKQNKIINQNNKQTWYEEIFAVIFFFLCLLWLRLCFRRYGTPVHRCVERNFILLFYTFSEIVFERKILFFTCGSAACWNV